MNWPVQARRPSSSGQNHELLQQQLWQPSARLSLGIFPPSISHAPPSPLLTFDNFFSPMSGEIDSTNLITLKTDCLIERNRHCMQKSYTLHLVDHSISTHSQRLPQIEPWRYLASINGVEQRLNRPEKTEKREFQHARTFAD